MTFDPNSPQGQQFASDAMLFIIVGAITLAGIGCMLVTVFAPQLYQLIFIGGFR